VDAGGFVKRDWGKHMQVGFAQTDRANCNPVEEGCPCTGGWQKTHGMVISGIESSSKAACAGRQGL
jgi:hypothetical protein